MFLRRWHLAALLSAVGFYVGGLQPLAAGSEIVWEVENRFRFYRSAEIFRNYARIADEAGTAGDSSWILNTEHKLQDHYFRADSAVFTATAEARGDRSKWNGWASLWRNETCWDRQRFRLINDGRCEDYIVPASHRVIVSVNGASPEANCTWSIEPFGSAQSSQPALWKTRAAASPGSACRNVPIEVPYTASGEAGVNVSVRVMTGGLEQVIPAEKIAVKDLLILGMGDSFGAGVGNPDRPARIETRHGVLYDDFILSGLSKRAVPVRLGGSDGAETSKVFSAQAEWLDIRCYRSQYGPQFRMALHLAVALKHAAITYLDLACDGARVIEGLLHRKMLGRGFANNTPPPESQIGFASRLLCADRERTTSVAYALRAATSASQCEGLKERQICEFAEQAGKIAARYQNDTGITQTSMRVCRQSGNHPFRRTIDAILLSIGGNDIGFAPMVGHALVDDQRGADLLITAVGRRVGAIHDGETGRKRLALLKAKYHVLDQAIDRFLPARQGTTKPIFLAAYPIPVDARDGALCGSEDENAAAATSALDVSQVFARFSGQRSLRARQPGPLARLKDIIRTTCFLNLRRLGWFNSGAAAEEISALTGPHGLCEGMQDAANEASAEKINWHYVTAHLQTFKSHGFCAHRAVPANPLQATCPSQNSVRFRANGTPSFPLPAPTTAGNDGSELPTTPSSLPIGLAAP